jgi:penicillin-binding protein 1A
MAQKTNTQNKSSKRHKILFKKILEVLFLRTLGRYFSFFLFASWGLFGKMPSFEDLENPDSNLATEIISSDGVTLGKFYNEKPNCIKYK